MENKLRKSKSKSIKTKNGIYLIGEYTHGYPYRKFGFKTRYLGFFPK